MTWIIVALVALFIWIIAEEHFRIQSAVELHNNIQKLAKTIEKLEADLKDFTDRFPKKNDPFDSF